MKIGRLSFLSIALSLIISSLSGCSEYWWTRGQPPSTEELFVRANERVSESLKNKSNSRPDIAANAIEVQIILQQLNASEFTVSQAQQSLKALENTFKNLEGKVSYGNRPPLNEISGQLRAFETELKNKSSLEVGSQSALRLFAARVLMYFSTELNAPAPDPIA